MGPFGKLFSNGPSHPAIDPNRVAAKRIAEVAPQVKDPIGHVSGPLGIVPTDHASLFVGQPPEKFGPAWIQDGEISGLDTLVEAHGLKPPADRAAFGGTSPRLSTQYRDEALQNPRRRQDDDRHGIRTTRKRSPQHHRRHASLTSTAGSASAPTLSSSASQAETISKL